MKMASAFASSYYLEWVKTYSELFFFSRKNENRSNPEKLLSLQLTLADHETRIWEKIREGKELLTAIKRLPDSATQTEKIEGIELHIQIHKMLLNISRTIADGIVWRNINYNRFFLESSSRGFSTGAVNIGKPDSLSEFNWAKAIVDTFGSIVVVNDLTRFLRIGDLTEIDRKDIFIHEVKKLGKVIKNVFTLRKELKSTNAKLSKQSKRLLELQRTVFLQEIDTPLGKIRPRQISTKLKTHIEKIKTLMLRSEKEIFVAEYIEPFLSIEVTNFRAIGNVSREDLDNVISKLPRSSRDSKLTIIHSNFDAFHYDEHGSFLRAVAPYSVFPLKNNFCMDLISGYVKVQSKIDLEHLQSILKRHNWQIIQANETELDKYLKDIEEAKEKIYLGKLYEHNINFTLFTVRRGPFSMDINPTLIMRMTMEFLTFESFLLILEESYSRAAKIQKADIFYPVFSEKNLWN